MCDVKFDFHKVGLFSQIAQNLKNTYFPTYGTLNLRNGNLRFEVWSFAAFLSYAAAPGQYNTVPGQAGGFFG